MPFRSVGIFGQTARGGELVGLARRAARAWRVDFLEPDKIGLEAGDPPRRRPAAEPPERSTTPDVLGQEGYEALARLSPTKFQGWDPDYWVVAVWSVLVGFTARSA